MTEGIPEKADFEKALNDWFREAEQEESPFVDIRADELHSRIGDYPGPFHRMATCCEVMYEHYRPATDKIMQFPPKGKGASMEIRYALPRTPAKPGQNKAAAQPQAATFTVKCEYCHGTGRDVRNLHAQDNPCPAPGCSKEKNGLHILSGQAEDYQECKTCKGSGAKQLKAKKSQPGANLYQPCPDCNGTGIKCKAS
jgi:5-methylcytosine-specific restriction protein A